MKSAEMKNRELEIKKNWNKARKEEGGLEAVTKLAIEVKKNPAIGVDPYAAAIRYDNTRDFKYDDDDDVVDSRQSKPKMLALPAPEKTNDPSSSSAINSNRKEQVSSSRGGLAWQVTQSSNSNSNDKLFDSREDILNILD